MHNGGVEVSCDINGWKGQRRPIIIVIIIIIIIKMHFIQTPIIKLTTNSNKFLRYYLTLNL